MAQLAKPLAGGQALCQDGQLTILPCTFSAIQWEIETALGTRDVRLGVAVASLPPPPANIAGANCRLLEWDETTPARNIGRWFLSLATNLERAMWELQP